jgi:putative cell wall-binding protein
VQVPVGSTSWSGRVYDVTSVTDDESGRLGTWFEHRAQTGRSTYWDVDNVQIYTCRRAPVSRIAGADRYATSARVAGQFPAGQPVAYLATGAAYADAVAGAALAGSQDAPVLLVTRDAIPSSVTTELQRLAPQRIIVLGGAEAVSDDVLQQARW